jgi:malate dehydrogenase (oxaloacetate-decarboxylating)
VLGFPGIFRGALNANAARITQEMLIAAAETIAECTEPGELVPHPLDLRVHRAVALAVEEAVTRGQA